MTTNAEVDAESVECPNCRRRGRPARNNTDGALRCVHCGAGMAADEGAHRAEIAQRFRPKVSDIIGALRDPLRADDTHYELLGVRPGVTDADVERAFRRAFGSPQNQRMRDSVAQARRALKDPKLRARHDLTIYSETALRRLSPCPLDDCGALFPDRRMETALRWEDHFKKSFPDLGIAHSLGVFWYWWTMHEEARFQAILIAARDGGFPVHTAVGKLGVLDHLCAKEGLRCEAQGETVCTQTSCRWREDRLGRSLPLPDMWRRVIAYWTMIEGAPQFGENILGVNASDGMAIASDFVSDLGQRILDLADLYTTLLQSAGGGDDDPPIEKVPGTDPRILALLRDAGFVTARDLMRAGVRKLSAVEGLSGAAANALMERARGVLGTAESIPSNYRALALELDHERATARSVVKAEVRVRGQVAYGGVLLLRQVGMTSAVNAGVQAALAANPGDQRLKGLRDALSPYHHVAMLLDSKRPSEALEVIARLSSADQQSPDVRRLRVHALHLIAREEASLGQFDDALNTWDEVLRGSEPGEFRDSVKKEIAESSVARAQALRKYQSEQAIALLSMAHKLCGEHKVGILLAEMLTQRGIDHFVDGQKKADDTPAVIAPLLAAAAEGAGAQDWDRAVNRLREALDEGLKAPQRDPTGVQAGVALCELGLRDIEAAARLGYKRAKEQLEIATNAMVGVRGSWRATVSKNLAISLTNRAIDRVNVAGQRAASGASMTALFRDSEQDLLEASALDPGSEHVKKNLELCRNIMSRLGLSPGRLDPSRRPKGAAAPAASPAPASGGPQRGAVPSEPSAALTPTPAGAVSNAKGKSGCLAAAVVSMLVLWISMPLFLVMAGARWGQKVWASSLRSGDIVGKTRS